MAEAAAAGHRPADSIKIRTFSDVIYLYPTWIASVICGLVVKFSGADLADPGSTGLVFSLLFFFNLTIIAFDYTRLTSVVILLIMVILGLLSSMYAGFRHALINLFDQPLFMNTSFYWTWAVLFTLVMAGVFIKSRLDYWELRNQELLHHHGFMGDTERMPAPNLRINKEINDVAEYMLLRAGRLVIVPRGESRAIVIDNVPGINTVERRMQEILGTLRVVDGD